jgi:hypothetical protein
MLMAPPGRDDRNERHLMRVRENAFDGFDLNVEVRRLLWCAAGVLAAVLLIAAKLSL